MKKSTRKLIISVIIYLIISSMYIGVRIDFKEPIYYENYTETSIFHNLIRLIMGIPAVVNGYEGVSPKYLSEIVIKIIIAIILSIYLIINNFKYKNKKLEIEKGKEVIKIEKNIKILSTIAKMIISILIVVIFLLSLYMTYCNIHSIR